MKKMNLMLVHLLWKYRKILIYVFIISVLLSSIVALLIPPRYKSEAIIYPANLKVLSDETPTDQLMQFLNSFEVKEIIREKLKLDEHYKIKPTSKLAQVEYLNTIKENVSLNQTKYGSIEILVYDEVPKMAYDIVYGIIDGVNKHIRNSLNLKTEEFVKMHLDYTESKKRRMDSLEIVLKDLSKDYGLLDYFIQVEQASKSYYREVPNGKAQKLEEVMTKLGQKGVIYMNLMEQYKSDMLYFNESRQEYEKGIRDINKKFTYVTIASKPVIPVAKDSPKRTLIVVFITFISLIFSCLIIILTEKLKTIKEEFKNQ
jgi:LPS O-antigen subunit length determinant protein (WzzB/FepE family)